MSDLFSTNFLRSACVVFFLQIVVVRLYHSYWREMVDFSQFVEVVIMHVLYIVVVPWYWREPVVAFIVLIVAHNINFLSVCWFFPSWRLKFHISITMVPQVKLLFSFCVILILWMSELHCEFIPDIMTYLQFTGFCYCLVD